MPQEKFVKDDCISRTSLYNLALGLEQEAMSMLKSLFENGDLEKIKIWSAVLIERTAFKFNVIDAPTVK